VKGTAPLSVAVLAIAAFAALGAGNILTTSPVVDEPVHLAAGWSYLETGDYRLNPEHPPLLKLAAALPLRFMRAVPATRGWEEARTQTLAQWTWAHDFFWSGRNDARTMFTRARLVMLLFGLGLAVLVFLWSLELWGWWGGVVSVTLFAFDPNFIAHSGLVTTDVGVTALMFAAVYGFWRCRRRFTAWNVAVFAIAFALAQVAKFSALILVPVILLLALQWRTRRALLAIGAAAVTTWIVIWGAYRFQASSSFVSPRRMAVVVDDWYTVQRLLPQYPGGPPEEVIARERNDTRPGLMGRMVLFAWRHHLLPDAYLYGFALVERSSLVRYSFLRGETSMTGFRGFFFWTFLYKTTIPAIAAIGTALWLSRRRKGVAFLLWPVVVYTAFAVAAAISIGHRHLFPVYPFLYVLCGALAAMPRRATAFVLLSAVSALCVFVPRPSPMWGRHLSYINEIGGGPLDGYEKLIDSNFDWGQDLVRLGEWVRARQLREPLRLVYFGQADPRAYGVAFVNLPFGSIWEPQSDVEVPPRPGYFAISASSYQGIQAPPGMSDYWKRYLAEAHAQLVDRAGYSILIYRIP
jgi:hypothetical protein